MRLIDSPSPATGLTSERERAFDGGVVEIGYRVEDQASAVPGRESG